MISAADISACFLLGLLGTGHCIGMCGPLVFAFPGKSGRVAPHLFYHGGRIATYTLLGAAVAAVGTGLSHAGGPEMVGRLQVSFSLVAAGALLALAMMRLGLLAEPGWMARINPASLPGMKRVLAGSGRGYWRMALIGLAMGLLPCGLSYAALARAMAAGGLVPGAVLLFGFGMGTLPGLLLVGLGAAGLFQRYRTVMELLAALLMIAMALRLIANAIWPG